MGRPNPILTIWVAHAWINHPAISALEAQGHRVYDMGTQLSRTFSTNESPEPDLILHPAAHWWSNDMWDYIPAALVAARKRRKTHV